MMMMMMMMIIIIIIIIIITHPLILLPDSYLHIRSTPSQSQSRL